jgi:hypothetical protein
LGAQTFEQSFLDFLGHDGLAATGDLRAFGTQQIAADPLEDGLIRPGVNGAQGQNAGDGDAGSDRRAAVVDADLP